jgi:beta-N-acetylhexosaminidase
MEWIMPNLFMVDLLGTDISEEEKNILKHPNVGALLLFSHNFKNPEQLKRLIERVHVIRPDIFIATDHEGGIVQRFQRHGFFCLPAAEVYGETYDLNPEVGIGLAERYGEIMAKDLLAYGVDLSLAPVLDIHGISSVIGKLNRAFHDNPNVVVTLASAFIKGMNKAGMPAVGKHFPGHGSVSSDSHISKPILDTSMEVLKEKDLKPFIELINKKSLAAVMPAHVTYTAIDAEQPSGFSKIWLQDILRNQLNFKGLILSDCLSMAGADTGNSIITRVYQAVLAGCDMVIFSHQPRSVVYEILQATMALQTEESINRIEVFKRQMIRFAPHENNKITPYLTHTIYSEIPTNLVDTPTHNDDVLDKTTII